MQLDAETIVATIKRQAPKLDVKYLDWGRFSIENDQGKFIFDLPKINNMVAYAQTIGKEGGVRIEEPTQNIEKFAAKIIQYANAAPAKQPLTETKNLNFKEYLKIEAEQLIEKAKLMINMSDEGQNTQRANITRNL